MPGYSLIGAIEETSVSRGRRQIMAVNFFGPDAADADRAAALPQVSAAGTSSTSRPWQATIGFPWSAMYSASKSALAAWSDALAAETAALRHQGDLS